MKIEPTKIRLVVIAFVCGFLFCALLIVVSERTPPVIANAPKLASSQIAGPFIIRLPDQRPRGPIKAQGDLQDDAHRLPGSRPLRNLDLIDMRAAPIDPKDIQ